MAAGGAGPHRQPAKEERHMLRDHAVTHETDSREDWPEVLDRYGVQHLVLDGKADARLLQQFRAAPRWFVDLEDQGSVLLVRTGKRQEAPSTTGPRY